MFDYLARTAGPDLSGAIRRSKQTAGFYRIIEDNGDNCHVPLFAGVDRISIGSCYWKGNFDDATLERLVAANAETSTDPEPDQRYLRGSWWHLRTDLGRDTPADALPERLGAEVEVRYDLKLWIAHSPGDATYLPR